MNFIPEQNSNIDELEKVFFLMKNTDETYQLFLKDKEKYFLSFVYEDDFKYSSTFFLWYTLDSIREFNSLSEDQITLFFDRQIPEALLLDNDIWRLLMGYLSMFSGDEKQLQIIYSKWRNAFMQSGAIIGYDNNNPVKVSEIIKRINRLNLENNDSLKTAELYTFLQRILLSRKDNWVVSSPDDFIDKLVGLTNFFLGVEPNSIFYILDGYLHPAKYQDNIKAENKKDQYSSELDSKNGVDRTETQDKKNTPSYQQIKQIVDTKFSPESGINNIEGIMSLLDNLAVTYNDDQIRDLYIFDEQTGNFVWNKDLLTPA